MSFKKHNHIPADIIRAQINFSDSPAGFETAKNIIKIKLRNSRFILTNYHQTRKRYEQYSSIATIDKTIFSIFRMEKELVQAKNFKDVFEMEGRAASSYWRSIKIICNQKTDWKRIHPKAKDPLNILLNAGYIMLAGKIFDVAEKVGLLPEIGILHRNEDALVYDFMETWRQPLVDKVIFPIFSRRRSGLEDLSPKFFSKIAEVYEQRIFYKTTKEKFVRIIELELVSLKKTIKKGTVWSPFEYRWGHRKP